MKELFTFFNKLSSTSILLIGILLVFLLGMIDYLSGYELSFSVFYLLPVALVGWYTERKYAILISVMSAVVWLGADLYAGHEYSHPMIPIWNAIMRLGFFWVLTFSLYELKVLLNKELSSAKIDFLTGISNRKAFMENVQTEIERSLRFGHPFTLVYIDVDHFKQINDTLGHAEGDALLQTIAKTIQTHTRSIDIIARLGGDEFAILLLEVNEDTVKLVIEKLQKELLTTVKNNDWAVTFSIGSVTSFNSSYPLEQLIKEADDLMYTVKKSGKNRIAYKTLASESIINNNGKKVNQ